MTTARKATLDDMQDLLDMSQAMHGESRYANLALDLEKLRSLYTRLIESPNGIVLRTANGFLAGGVGTYFFGPATYAFQYVLYVSPEARGSSEAPALVKAYVAAAKDLRVVDVHIENSTGCEVDKVERFFIKLGFARLGGNFIMEL